MQTSVPSGERAPYQAGRQYRLSGLVRDLFLLEAAKHGAGLVRSQLVEGAGRLPNMNSYVGALNADMVSGGTASLVGYTETPAGVQDAFSINVSFDTNQATTATAIKTAIEAAATDVLVTISNSNRTFTVVASADKKLVITTPFTRGGSGSATFTNTKGTTDVICAIAPRKVNSSVPLSSSLATRGVPTLSVQNDKGAFVGAFYQSADPAVPVNNTVKAGQSAYCLLEDYTDQAAKLNPRGTFRSDTDEELAPVVKVDYAEFAYPSNGSLAPLSINRP